MCAVAVAARLVRKKPSSRCFGHKCSRAWTVCVYVEYAVCAHTYNIDAVENGFFWEIIQVKSYDVLFPCNLWSMTLALDMYSIMSFNFLLLVFLAFFCFSSSHSLCVRSFHRSVAFLLLLQAHWRRIPILLLHQDRCSKVLDNCLHSEFGIKLISFFRLLLFLSLLLFHSLYLSFTLLAPQFTAFPSSSYQRLRAQKYLRDNVSI